jgi:hypothetical protein
MACSALSEALWEKQGAVWVFDMMFKCNLCFVDYEVGNSLFSETRILSYLSPTHVLSCLFVALPQRPPMA